MDVAELPASFHEKIAWIHIAIVFDHRVAVATVVHGASAGLLSRERLGDVVEIADSHGSPLEPPKLEQFAEELAVRTP